MNKLKNILLCSFLMLIFFSSTALASTLNVGAGSTYSTDGTDDQVQINNAISAASTGDIVNIMPGMYYISSPINMKSGITLRGSGIGSTTIHAVNPSSNFGAANLISCVSVSNCHISDFTLDGGWESLAVMHEAPNHYRDSERGVSVKGSSYIYIHDLKYQLSMGDFVFCSGGSSYVEVYNTIATPGHDSFDAWSCGAGIKIYNNLWDTFVNSCIKISATKNVEIYHNTFYTDTSSGNAGVEIMNGDMTGMNIHNNVFRTIRLTPIYTDTSDGAASGSITINNNIFYSCSGSISCSGVTVSQTGNQVTSTLSSTWGADGFGYVAGAVINPIGVVYNGSVLPTLTSPTPTQTLSTTNGNIYFYWQDVNSTSYRVRVSNVTDFATILYNDTAVIPIGVSLANGTYYWDVAAYDDVHHVWTAYTSYSTFTVSGNVVVAPTSGMYGVVYDTITNGPIHGAVVIVSNNTWSDNYVTDASGLYEFNLGPNTGTYYVTVTATNYAGASGLPVNMSGAQIKLDIALTESPSYFQPHYVRLVVTDKFLTRYSNALVDVYGDGNSVSDGNPNFESYTDDGGKVVFELQQNTMYTIVTTLNGVSQTDTLMPDNVEYYIIIPQQTITAVIPQFYDKISINVTKSIINSTSAWINVTYADSESNTNYVGFVLGTIQNNAFVAYPVAGNHDTWDNPTGGNANDSFIVTDYLGKEYVLNTNVDSTTFGVVTKQTNIAFPGSSLPFYGDIELSYLALFVLITVALMFDRSTHHIAGIVCCGLYWIFLAIGLWAPLFIAHGVAANTFEYAFPAVASIYAILVYLNQAEINGNY